MFARCLQPRIAREGVSIGMWFVLRMLWDEDGMTQRELGERVGINGPTMVTALNSMERAGLVKRVHNQVDRRKINVFLTKRGREFEKQALADGGRSPGARLVRVDPQPNPIAQQNARTSSREFGARPFRMIRFG